MHVKTVLEVFVPSGNENFDIKLGAAQGLCSRSKKFVQGNVFCGTAY